MAGAVGAGQTDRQTDRYLVERGGSEAGRGGSCACAWSKVGVHRRTYAGMQIEIVIT